MLLEREAEHRVHVEQAAAFLKTQLAPGGFALFGLDWLEGADGVKIFEDAMPADFSYKLCRAKMAWTSDSPFKMTNCG